MVRFIPIFSYHTDNVIFDDGIFLRITVSSAAMEIDRVLYLNETRLHK